ncbi:MAG: flagellin [Acidocella sp.]|nr:flagellin [Acidocella sp.]
MSAVGSIVTNTGALEALNAISNTASANNSLESQLSSGLSINSPADNPAGYITAQGFTSQLNGLTQAISNANQGVSLLQTAQGAITQQIGVVQQLNSIAVQAANGTQTPAESQSLQSLVSQLTGQVNTIATQTQFNNISLLNGAFSGVQFQVGANEGQTQTLTIANLQSSAIGLNRSSASAAIYKNFGSGGGVVTTGTATALPTTGAFTVSTATTPLSITGASGKTATVAVGSTTESAATLATAINNVAGTTGVQAQATTTATFALSNTTAGSGFAFTIQADKGGGAGTIGAAQSIVASSAAQVVSQVNGSSSTSGITASLNTAGDLVLTQASGDNIDITAVKAGVYTPVGGTTAGVPAGTITGNATTPTSALIQGQVQFQSSGAFSVKNGSEIGLKTASTLTALSSINVSTTAGANTAINVVKYALAALNNQGGQLGAVQQALGANINNLNTTSQNLTSALGVVQDANIPSVANKLTEAQIQAQSGVAALKSSTQLQQSYLSLLP